MTRVLSALGEGQDQLSALRRVPVAAMVVLLVLAMNIASVVTSLSQG